MEEITRQWVFSSYMIAYVSRTIEECEISDNQGIGVRFDACNSGNSIVIRNNRMSHTLQGAVFVEKKQKCTRL